MDTLMHYPTNLQPNHKHTKTHWSLIIYYIVEAVCMQHSRWWCFVVLRFATAKDIYKHFFIYVWSELKVVLERSTQHHGRRSMHNAQQIHRWIVVQKCTCDHDHHLYLYIVSDEYVYVRTLLLWNAHRQVQVVVVFLFMPPSGALCVCVSFLFCFIYFFAALASPSPSSSSHIRRIRSDNNNCCCCCCLIVKWYLCLMGQVFYKQNRCNGNAFFSTRSVSLIHIIYIYCIYIDNVAGFAPCIYLFISEYIHLI